MARRELALSKMPMHWNSLACRPATPRPTCTRACWPSCAAFSSSWATTSASWGGVPAAGWWARFRARSAFLPPRPELPGGLRDALGQRHPRRRVRARISWRYMVGNAGPLCNALKPSCQTASLLRCGTPSRQVPKSMRRSSCAGYSHRPVRANSLNQQKILGVWRLFVCLQRVDLLSGRCAIPQACRLVQRGCRRSQSDVCRIHRAAQPAT